MIKAQSSDQVRDAAARNHNATKFGSKICFKAGWDAAREYDAETIKILTEALEKLLPAATWFHEGPNGPSPDIKDLSNAREALKRVREAN